MGNCCSIQIRCGAPQDVTDPEKVQLGMPPTHHMQFGEEDFERMRPRSQKLQMVAANKTIFDAHCHYLNYMQQTEGIATLSSAMEKVRQGAWCTAVTSTALRCGGC